VRGLVLILLLAGCAEMRRPPPAEPPAALSGGDRVDSLSAIIGLAAQDFDQQGAALAGRPAATAMAAARLEWLAGEGGQGGRLAGVPPSFRFGLQRGVEEIRASLGIHPDVSPTRTVPALLALARSLPRGEALPEGGVFRPGVPPLLRRLEQPGALPNAALATAALREEYGRQREERRTDPRVLFDSPGAGLSTFGLGGSTDR
jgi:hypothetical protein